MKQSIYAIIVHCSTQFQSTIRLAENVNNSLIVQPNVLVDEHVRQTVEAVFCHSRTEVRLDVFEGTESAFTRSRGDRKAAENA